MKYDDLAALDRAATLAAAEERTRARRAGDVQDLLHALHWCDLHSVDPQGEPGGCGPVLLDKLSDLLDGRELVVQPVIDLGITRSVNGYEHPTAVRQRTLLRTLGDVFPHSTSRGTARLDHDHPMQNDPQGPPGSPAT